MAENKGHQNIKPPKKGEVRNPKGKPKGTLDFRKRVKKMLADPGLAAAVLKNRPAWWQALEQKDFASAMTVAMMIKAAGGDPQAFNALIKAGYGDKLDLVSDNERIQATPLILSVVKPREVKVIEARAKRNAKSKA